MGGLLGDVVALGVIRKVPVASKGLAQNWVEWFLDSAICPSISPSPNIQSPGSTYGGLMCHPLR